MAMTLQDFIDKYGTESGTKRYNGKQETLRKRAETYKTHPYTRLTRDWFIWRYPEDGQQRFDDHVNKSRQSEEAMIARHGEEKGKQIWAETVRKKNTVELTRIEYGDAADDILTARYKQAVETQQARPDYAELRRARTEACAAANKKNKGRKKLDIMIENHGEIEGTRKYHEMLAKQFSGPCRMSAPANVIFDTLKQLLPNAVLTELYCDTEGKHEYRLYDKPNKRLYGFDFTILNPKVILEYDGEYWHPTVLSMKKHSVTKQPLVKMWMRDQEKRKFAEASGFKVFTIRSNYSPEYQQQILTDFINHIEKERK